jgi:hypothetical protein
MKLATEFLTFTFIVLLQAVFGILALGFGWWLGGVAERRKRR